MAKAALSRTYYLGCPQLDQDHEALFSIVDRFEEALAGTPDFARLAALKVELDGYFDTHFANERALMKKTGYPEMEAHERDHLDARRKCERIAAVMKDDPWAARAMFFVLKGWMVTHLRRADRRLAEHLKAHPSE